MSPENKQRVVGVIVLVAFIALLVPFLFTSGVKKNNELAATEVTIPIETSADQLSDISPVMQQPSFSQESPSEVSGTTTESLQLPSTALSPDHAEKGNMFPDSDSQSGSSDVMPQQQPAEPNLNNNVNGDLQEPTVAPTVKVKAAVKPIKAKAAVKKSTKKNIAKKKASKAKAVAMNASTFWSVQVGSFSDQSRMQNMVNSLQAKGYHVYLQKISTSRGAMVRVLVGRETSKSKAVAIANQLKTKLKINGRVVGSKK